VRSVLVEVDVDGIRTEVAANVGGQLCEHTVGDGSEPWIERVGLATDT
jgi:hypothetical protein